MTVETRTTRAGTVCLTLCPTCAATPDYPIIAPATAARLTAHHLVHVGMAPDARLREVVDAVYGPAKPPRHSLR